MALKPRIRFIYDAWYCLRPGCWYIGSGVSPVEAFKDWQIKDLIHGR